MSTCSQCKNKFKDEPFIGYPNKKKYCSLKCIPDSAMDQPYSFEYFNLIEILRDIEIRINNIITLENRIELEKEVNELSYSYTVEVYGDDEGLFYKRQIILLLPTFDELYRKINNIFIERKVQLRLAVVIYWDSVIQLFGEELSEMIFRYFESRMEGISYENVYYTDPSYRYDLGCFKDKLWVNTLGQAESIKNVYIRSLNYFKSLFTEKQLAELECCDNYVSVKNIAYCAVCDEWEDWDDFSLDDKLMLYKCNQWGKCSQYDDYYED